MSRFIYIVILIASALFYPLYKDKLSYVTLVAVTALPVIMFLQLMISALLLKCSTKRGPDLIFKGSEGEARINLINNSVFALSGVSVCARVTYYPTGETKRITADIPLPAMSTQTVTVNISPKNCGRAEVCLEYVKIYDLLRLFSLKLFKNKGSCGTLCIVPKVSEKYFGEARVLMEAKHESGDSSGEINGDSGAFGDVSGYREFVPGDRLSRLHHKLSARFDNDIVRVMSPDKSGSFLLTADLSAVAPDDTPEAFGERDISAALDKRDKRLEKMLSVAYYLAREGARVYMAVPEGADCAGINIGGISAAVCTDKADCLAAAKALCGADFGAAETGGAGYAGSGEYVTVRIEDNDEEIT